MLIHGGQYFEGSYYAPQELLDAAADLNAAGYLVFSVDHRLAPPGQIVGQPDHSDPASGRPPQQSNDIKQQFLAAKYHPKCNGTVFVIGGSSGGAHAAWIALDLEDTTNNNWGLTTRPKAIVGLSGAYDLSSRNADTQQQLNNFVDIVLNYTNTTNRDPGDPNQYAASAISRIALISAGNILPMRLYNSLSETMPHQQMEGFRDALNMHGFFDVVTTQLSGSQHAFHYWNRPIIQGGPTVGQDVIAFLNAHLQ
jgi:acetyl esterase/lipase